MIKVMPQFRAYNNQTNVMAEVFGLDIPNKILSIFTPELGQMYWAGDHITLIRCSGLTDEKGNLLYQGDVIRQAFQNEFGSFTPGVGVIVWNNPDAAFQVKHKKEFYLIDSKKCQRLGSDFTNPEILEEAIKRNEA